MFRYILFDSCQHPRFHQKLQQRNILYGSLFEGHAEESLPEIAPLLIDVTVESEATQKVIDETTRIGQLKPCVSVLESTLPLFLLTDHFAQFHLIERPDGQSMLMRWYDTRILPVWLDALTAEQRMFFTRGIAQWTSIDRFGDEQRHPIAESDIETAKRASLPLQLDASQAERLQTASEPDALIYELRKTIAKQIDSIPHRVLYPFIHTHWQMARQHGLCDRHAQTLWLTLALRTSGKFVEHPTVAERFASPSSQPEQPFADWFNTLPDDLWELGKPLWEQ
ncbi:DUF4123 domain-containing protein [Dyella sp. M7H15-1]|uniref:DUF4123 domain-containing protein n=1 Tax=Dyella sp. M7H15-1 TaxID=2501295 RepID=UPI0010051A3E|nr:DUF4123 domain-containing protein [Dyella sp. M7H15-1]QAU23562.1 DUF4123 domain-containing protein [Dyella sp. M7H15-1]QAU23829.1 DUF4123 domain-containing protein [Dyella sp. M7H15-1]